MVKEFSIPAERQIEAWGYVYFPSNDGAHNLEAYIKVPLTRCERPKFQPTRTMVTPNYYNKFYFDLEDTTEAISPSSVPSVESLLRAHLITTRNYYCEPSPFSGLYKAFRDFAESYCSIAVELPLVTTLLA